MTTSQVGSWAESEARRYLETQGLRLLRQNFRCKFGEIDLVMLDGDTIVFVEVRYRANSRFGAGFETITTTKQQRLIKTASFFLSRYHRFARRCCRFDVVSVAGRHYDPQSSWIRDAFQSW